ncbi:MAG TPA: Hsp20/alpha crystallin family protein [Nitrosopumilaceae archaeon]|nr:Hsp20/alpha crystallin family protein [Nitrosopumilaceae archaeon]
MTEKNETINIQNIFPILFPKLIDDIDEKTLSPLSCITELESKWIMEFDLPLVDKDDISVTFDTGNIITIEAKLREAYSDETLHSKYEFHYFKKKISIPGVIDEKRITSNFSNGRLVINIPKVFRGKKIKIE